MLVYFTDAVTQNKFAVNPEYVVGVFIANEKRFIGGISRSIHGYT
jgi:hypothetical protein